MPTASFTVQFVNPPKGNARNGSVKTENGDYYGVPKAMLSQFEKGGKYEIEYNPREWEGKTYKDVTQVLHRQAAPAGSTSGTYRETSMKDAERMFVTAMARAFVQAGKIEPSADHVKRCVMAMRTAWKETFGADDAPKPAPKPPVSHDDMNDEIPF